MFCITYISEFFALFVDLWINVFPLSDGIQTVTKASCVVVRGAMVTTSLDINGHQVTARKLQGPENIAY